MRWPVRNFVRVIVPVSIAAAAALSSVAAMSLPAPDPGLHLAYRDGQVVVASVDYGTAAQMSGLEAGDVVVQLDDAEVLRATEAEKRAIAQAGRSWSYVQTVPPYLVADELVAKVQASLAEALGRILTPLYAANPNWCAPDGTCGMYLPSTFGFSEYGSYHYLQVAPPSSLPVFVGLAILIGGWWLLRRGRAGAALEPYALTLPLATAVPLLVLPLERYPTLPATVIASVLVPLAMLPLAFDFLERIRGNGQRRLMLLLILALAIGSLAAGLQIPSSPGSGGTRLWRALLAGCVAFAPGLAVARPSLSLASIMSFLGRIAPARPAVRRLADFLPTRRSTSELALELGHTPRAFVERADVLAAAVTPGIAAASLAPASSVEVWPVLLWFVALLIATRFTLRPLVRLALAATRQRDLVMAATERERARIAADIHDDALQDLTMLVRRLDAAGDPANAEAAREVAQRLRDICGDLRLPVLDDLGVGPALDWLCGRSGSGTGRVALERGADETRFPAEVELAVFRVAQEGLSNAIKHGARPIVVRYRAGDGWIELEVDDAGPGLAADAATKAELTGHLGLMNMTQRAETIGAALNIGRRPGGGTRVSLVWERSAGRAAATATVRA